MKKLYIPSVMLALLGQPATAQSDTPAEAEAAVEAFKTICFDAFPDPDAIVAEIEKPSRGLVKLEKSARESLQPGDTWESDGYDVGLVAADWMPKDIPSVQCSVTTLVGDQVVHPDGANELAQLIGLGKGKIGKDRPRSQSRWDLKDKNWRLFYSTSPEGNEVRVRYTLLLLKK